MNGFGIFENPKTLEKLTTALIVRSDVLHDVHVEARIAYDTAKPIKNSKPLNPLVHVRDKIQEIAINLHQLKLVIKY